MNCEACGLPINEPDTPIKHHINYELNLTVMVHKSCHNKIHHGEYPNLAPIYGSFYNGNKTKIELDKETVNELLKQKSVVGDTYSIIIEILLKKQEIFDSQFPDKKNEIENEVRNRRKPRETTQQLA